MPSANTETEEDSSTLDAPRANLNWTTAFAFGLVVAVLAPIIAVLLARIGRSYTPAGDIGLIDLRVRDIASFHFPLVGPYGNRGWDHPGPLLFYLLAIPSLLTGGAAWGTQVGGVLLQATAVVWLAWLAWRRGGLPVLAVAMVGVSLLGHATSPFVLRDPWNPHIALPFFALFVFQAWLVATGDARALVGCVAVATFLVQSHIGYLPFVVAAALVVGCFLLVDRSRRARAGAAPDAAGPERWRRPVRWSLIVFGVLWLPPVLDVVLHPPGNLWNVGAYFVGSDEHPLPKVGLERAAHLLATEFSTRPTWLRGPEDLAIFFGTAGRSVAWLLVPVLLVGAGVVTARRRHDSATLRFLGLAAVLVVVGLVALARVDGTLLPYQFLWRPALAIALVLGIGWALFAGTVATRGSARTIWLVGAAVIVVWSSGTLARDVHQLAAADTAPERATTALARQALRHGVPPGGAILRFQESSLVQIQRGVYDELKRQGTDVFVDGDVAYQFPPGSKAAPESVDRVWWVVDNRAALTELLATPGAELVASASPLPAAREERARQLADQLFVELVAANRVDLLHLLDSGYLWFFTEDVDGIDHAAAKELSKLNDQAARHQLGAIVSFPPELAPKTLQSG